MIDNDIIIKVQQILRDKDGFPDISRHNVKRALLLVMDDIESFVTKRKKKPENAYERIVKDYRITRKL